LKSTIWKRSTTAVIPGRKRRCRLMTAGI